MKKRKQKQNRLTVPRWWTLSSRPVHRRAWVVISPRNLDELPSWLTPDVGCPRCDAVWVDYDAVGYPEDGAPTWSMNDIFDPDRFLVTVTRPVTGVRLVCMMDHRMYFAAGSFCPTGLFLSDMLREQRTTGG